MNSDSATKVLTASQFLSHNDVFAEVREETLVVPAPKFYLLVLMLAVALSALSLVYVKDLNRRMFVEYQTMQKDYVQLQVDEGKLLLEQSLLAPHTKIQAVAEQNFDMQMPTAKDVVMVKV
jgi:cell division protein FtsL